jgi:hypothetical protein
MNIQSLLIAVLLSTSVSVAAADKNPAGNKVRTWQATTPFHSVTVSDNVNIILAEDSSSTISIQGKAKLVDAIQLEIKDGVLHISSRRVPFTNKAVVYIPVRLLNRLTVNGASEVQTMGYLQSSHLHIKLDGPGKVSVKNTGAITIDYNQDWDLDYLKNKGATIKRSNP